MRLRALFVPPLLAALAFAPAVRAQDTGFGTPVPVERLESLRGGYALPGGLSVGIGLERTVAVNGEVVVSQHVDIPDVSRMTGEQARQLASLTQGQTVQVGGATTIDPGMGTLVIQNMLDGQRIQASTTLHATVNTLSLLQNLNFNQTLTGALRIGGSP